MVPSEHAGNTSDAATSPQLIWIITIISVMSILLLSLIVLIAVMLRKRFHRRDADNDLSSKAHLRPTTDQQQTNCLAYSDEPQK